LIGLFDFAANIGKKVFGIGDADAAEKIKQDIEANNPGIENLSVEMPEEDICVLGGSCEAAEAKEKAILMAGNMKGVKSVVANDIIITASATQEQADSAFEAASQTQYYIIESGDTLWGIAAKFLGNGSKYPEIFEANREVIEDPDKIFVGQKIRIPKA